MSKFMKDKKEVLENYLEYKKLKVNNLEKLRDITFHLKRFFKSAKKDLKDIKEEDLIQHLNKIKDEYATPTLNIIKSYLKNFIKWNYLDWSSRFRNLDSICRSEKFETSYTSEDMISEEDFAKLIRGEKDIFWKAFLSIHFYGACRTSEICKLKWIDFDFTDMDGGSFFNVYSKKNKRTFLKYLPQEATYFVNQLKNNGSEFIFYRNNKLLDRKAGYFHITQLSKKVLMKQIDLSTLRHSIATINYGKDNVKDEIIALQMGHSKSMKHNYTHNDKEKLKANAKKIYVGELPQEKKHALEQRIDVLEKAITELLKEEKLDISKEFKKHQLKMTSKEQLFNNLNKLAMENE